MSFFLYTCDKGDLVPWAPGLTCYKKEVAQKMVSNKKVVEFRLPDERRSSEINLHSTTTLCVCLNTLHASATSHRVPKIKVWYEMFTFFSCEVKFVKYVGHQNVNVRAKTMKNIVLLAAATCLVSWNWEKQLKNYESICSKSSTSLNMASFISLTSWSTMEMHLFMWGRHRMG